MMLLCMTTTKINIFTSKHMKALGYIQWILWGVGIIALIITNFWIHDFIKTKIDRQNYQIFVDIITEAEADIKNRLLFYEESLWGGVGLFNAAQSVERDEWKSYVEALRLDRYLGISGIGFIQKVPKKELNSFIKKAQKDYEGFERLTVGPIDSDEKFIILYIEPIENNFKAVGLDIGTESNRRRAAMKAIKTGKAVMTDPIVLVQDEDKTAGFLILLPVYDAQSSTQTIAEREESAIGWVYAPFIAKNFFQGILHTDTFLDFLVYDPTTPDITIYEEKSEAEEILFQAESHIFVARNTWKIRWKATPELKSRLASKSTAGVTLLLGLLITLAISIASGLLILRDQVNRKKVRQAQSSLKESESKFSEAFDNAAIGIALSDAEGQFLKVNQSLCEMTGHTEKELLQLTMQDITHEEDRAIDSKLIQELLDGESRAFTLKKRCLQKNQETIWVRLNVSLVRDTKGQPKFFVSEIEDITREKLLDDIKSDFISISSHQFRTPLSGIRWNLESLIDGGIKSYPAQKIKTILNDTLHSVLRMNELVRDLLRVSKIESGLIKAQLKPVDIKKVTKEVVYSLKPLAQNKKQKIVTRRNSETIITPADDGFLTEVVTILLNNAVHYAPEKSDITIEFEPKQSYFYLHIENDGDPIPPKEQKRLFEKFSRLQHGSKSNPDGSGLGLFIARNLLELMDGSVRYNNKKTDRIRFTIKLPRRKS